MINSNIDLVVVLCFFNPPRQLQIHKPGAGAITTSQPQEVTMGLFGRKKVALPPPVVFGLAKAESVYAATRGRFDGDMFKAVPFAMVATAQVLGAQVTIQSEAEAEVARLAAEAQRVETENAARQERAVRTIATLQEEIKNEERAASVAKSVAADVVEKLNGRKADVGLVASFFDIS